MVAVSSGMADLVLFHSVLGVRAGVTYAADRLRAAGHTVHAPNLYEDGVVFDDYERADAYVQALGYAELLRRARAAVDGLPQALVYAGFSNGGGLAEYLAAERPGALAAVLFGAAIPLAMFGQFGGDGSLIWPPSTPVQVHYGVDDPFREQAWVDSLADTVRSSGAAFQLYEYPIAGHLFTDESMKAEYDGDAAKLLWERVLSFLSTLSG